MKKGSQKVCQLFGTEKNADGRISARIVFFMSKSHFENTFLNVNTCKMGTVFFYTFRGRIQIKYF